MDEEKHQDDGFLLGFILGALVGAALSYVVAGENAEEIRKKLKRGGRAVLQQLGDLADEEKTKIGKEVAVVEKQAAREISDLEKTGKTKIRRFFLHSGKKVS